MNIVIKPLIQPVLNFVMNGVINPVINSVMNPVMNPVRNQVTPLSSRPVFPRVQAHGKFLLRVSRGGLGTSEMCVTKT